MFFRTKHIECILSHENKKALRPFFYKRYFIDRNECKTLIVCITFLFYKKYFLWENGLKAFLFSFDDMSSLRNALKYVL